MKNIFHLLKDESPVWLWISDRALSRAEQDALLQRLAVFQDSWSSHGRAVNSEAALLENRLLLLAGDVDAGDISGCGIDKSVHVLERAAAELGFTWLDGMDVVFRRPGQDAIEVATRAEFTGLAQSGAIDPETQIYDRNLATVGRYRAQGLTRPATEAWTARYFRTSSAS